MFDKFKLVFICLTLFFIVPLTASAGKPDSGGGSYFFEADEFINCGDFLILDDILMDVSWRDFYDKDGNLVRSRVQFTFDDDLYHEDFPDGIHLYGKGIGNNQSFFKDGEFWQRVTGAEVKITVPGYGHMFFDAGQLLFVDGEIEFVRGKNHNYFRDETDAICDYLGNQ